MSDGNDQPDETPDPLMIGVKRAAVHLGKAGFEVAAAIGALSTGISRKVRPPVADNDTDSGSERIAVD